MSEKEQTAASDDPTVLARLVRRAEEYRAERAARAAAEDGGGRVSNDPRDAVDPRTMLQNTGITTLVASQFLLSSSVSSYFMYGAGSLELADQPSWVAATFDPGTAGVDPGAAAGADFGGGGTDGAGFNGGEFGGGFDGAGFGGGGFDGAGG